MANQYLIPPEILLQIFYHCEDKSDLAALCLSSRAFCHLGATVLYEAITLDLNNRGRDAVSFVLLCQTLLRSPKLALLVKRLHIRLDLRRDRKDTPPLFSQWRTLSGVIKKCKNLRSLFIAHRYIIVHLISEHLGELLVDLPHLRELELDIEDMQWPPFIPGDTDINVSLFSRALEMPSITSIVIRLQEGPQSLLRVPTTLPINNNIVKLDLIEACFDLDSFGNIVSAVPQIRELNLSLLLYIDPITGTHIASHFDCEELGRLLEPVRSKLEKLKIAIQYECCDEFDVTKGSGEGSRWGLSRKLGTLQSYTNLKSLELGPEVLLGWDHTDSVRLSDFLPPSIESLYFRWDFRMWESTPWYITLLCPLLLDYLYHQPSALRKLILRCFNDEEEVVRDTLDDIQSKCNELGVDFDLDVSYDIGSAYLD